MSLTEALSFEDRITRLQISTRTREEIYGTLGSLLDNGALLRDSLDKLYLIYSDDGRKPKRATAIMLYELRGMIDDGKSFAAAIEKWVSPQEVALIDAGERSGNLRGAFNDALFLISQRKKMSGAIWGGVIYPVVLIATLVVMLQIITYKVIPPFTKIVPAETWEGAARLMYLLSYFVEHFGLFTLITLVALLIGTMVSLPNLTGSNRYWLDKVAPWSIYRRINGGLFLLNVAVLIGSGVKLLDALELLSAHANRYLSERIDAALYGVTKGLFFGDALRDADFDFPDKRTIGLLTILDKLDGFDHALRKFAVDDLERVQTLVEMSMRLMFYGMLVINALLTAMIMMGSLWLQNQMGNS